MLGNFRGVKMREFITKAHYPGDEMPTYEYKCQTCDTFIDRQVDVEDRDDAWNCPCGGPMKRVYTAVPVKFNGSGFYSTGG
jgi:putative FmdB family regulatory protein